MTATDELRRLLDERGVEYETADGWWTSWDTAGALDVDAVVYCEDLGSGLEIRWYTITPEQAIAATLGGGTCKMEQMPECRFDDIACSECGVALWAFSMDKDGEGVLATPNYCPYCGAKVVER